MTDEAFVLKQTNLERKRNGYGASHKKRGGGKQVRFPSDYLSKKEKMALNSDVKSWNLKRPMSWDEFKSMPHDVQQEYFDTISEKFPGVPNVAIADMFNVPHGRLSVFMSEHDLKITKLTAPLRVTNFLKTEAGIAWKRWIETDGGYAMASDVQSSEEVQGTEVESVAAESVEEVEDKPNVDNLANLIQALAGSGAKLTIEIIL